MPAAWRLCTARRVNMLPQTCTMALCSLDLSYGTRVFKPSMLRGKGFQSHHQPKSRHRTS